MNSSLIHTIVLNQKLNNATIVFVPTIKHMPQTLLVQNLNQDTKKIVQASVKQESKKTVKKAAEKKTVIAKKSESAKQAPKLSKTPTTKKEEKPQTKKIEKKPEPKKVEPKPIQKAKPITPESQQEQKVPEKQPEEPTQEIIYLGRDDKMFLDLHHQTQEQIEKVWHPPVGLSKDLLCSIKVKLDPKGGVIDLALEESSQVISYDIAARTALDSVVFPKGLWGKEVIITFKQ